MCIKGSSKEGVLSAQLEDDGVVNDTSETSSSIFTYQSSSVFLS
jgi:hypothetical protein